MHHIDSYADVLHDDKLDVAPLNRRRFGLLASIALASCGGLLSGCATDDSDYDSSGPSYSGTDNYQQRQDEEDTEFDTQRQSEDDQLQMESEEDGD